MHILCLGSEYFHEAFARLGHKVIAPPHDDGFPLGEFYHQLVDRPDVLVYTDHLGRHAWPDGLEQLDIPKIYYAVDTPINIWWQKHFAGLFDLCFVDQKPYVEVLKKRGIEAQWLPVGVNTKAYQGQENTLGDKIYDFGFVGVLDDKVRAKRSRLVKQLSGRYSLKAMGDHKEGWVEPEDSASLYRQSRLILNENLFPGVTTRMFEAMASGNVLFTEKAGGDLGELFMPGEDFAWFEPQELFEAAEYWLADEDRLRKVAKRALDKVLSAHDISHRAERVLQAAAGLNLSRGPAGAEAWDLMGRTLFLTALRWPAESGKERLLRAEKQLENAAETALSPEGKFMLGHIARMKGEQARAETWLGRAWDEGFQRAALGLGLLSMSLGNTGEAARWFGAFSGLGSDFPELTAGTLHYEAVLPIAAKLMGMDEAITPGFNFMIHDPALWTAFEFYLSAHQAKPESLEVGRALSALLYNTGAPAEAMDVAAATLAHHPQDEVLSRLYSQGARSSYMSLN